MEEIQRMINLYDRLYYLCLGFCICFLILSIILFFKFGIWNMLYKIKKHIRMFLFLLITVGLFTGPRQICAANISEEPLWKVEIKFPEGWTQKAVYNGNVRLQAVISDEKESSRDEMSGICKVYYQVGIGKHAAENAEKNFLYTAEKKDVQKVVDKIFSFEISAKDFNSNNVFVKVTAVDFAGNRMTASKILKIDITKPIITVAYEMKTSKEDVHYCGQKRTVIVTIKERNIQAEDSEQLFWELKREGESRLSKCGVTELAKLKEAKLEFVTDSQEKWKDTPELYTDNRKIVIKVIFGTDDVDGSYQFNLHCTDEAGNYDVFSSEKIVVDHMKPDLKMTVSNLTASQNGIFNENVILKLEVEDPVKKDSFSGLEKVWYRVQTSGNVVKSDERILLDHGNSKLQGSRIFSRDITLPAGVYNSNDVKVQVFARDFAGNESHSDEMKLKIDVTEPRIFVDWDVNEASNEKYYKTARTAIITVQERNFDPDNVKFDITNTDGTLPQIGSWVSGHDMGVSDDASNVCRVIFPEDGDYTFTFACIDRAGNSSVCGRKEEFTIDTTAPIMTVSYDDSSAENGRYYRKARTASIIIREHNFNEADVKAQITANLEGKNVPAPCISRFFNSGDLHTAKIKYGADGDYTFDLDYADLAGNAAADHPGTVSLWI